MAGFIIRRVIGMVAVLFAISLITFAIFNVIPNGDPAYRLAGHGASNPETIAAIRREWGFDKPVYVQYVKTMQKIFDGTLISYSTQTNVDDEIRHDIGPTISLAVGAALMWMVFALCVGLYTALKAGKFADRFLTVLALIGISMPVFWVGCVAQLLPGVQGRDLSQRRLCEAHEQPDPVGLPPDPAVDCAVDPVRRRVLARGALEHARHDQRGLRAHRAGQGALAAPGAGQARAAQFADPGDLAVGARLRSAHRRRRDRHRVCVQPRRGRPVRGQTRSARSTSRR